MPPFLKKKEKQHSTEDANLSRMITNVRWIVEAVNGRIKKWKLLDKVLSNTLVPSIGDFVRITCSWFNKYRPPIAINTEEDVKWIQYTPEQISGWYCTCKVGARVVGCCAHIASALWYLGYERHEAKHSSGVDNNTTNIDDARHIEVSVSDSESDQTMEEE
ncbi:uncharacterized protein LOC128161076 [Crassostrea angulata]|uniref:uncharacterized protein LOC128161076 n=1 Tax=Magallana angulata TaxID=2784310 RepID=UPI0022B19E18|nr:uncharacterized protein LOC128161076 [Crassostrea angulata]